MVDDTKWVICPNCKSKTRLKLLPETVLESFPLFCPKCKKEVVIDARKQEITVIRKVQTTFKPDAKTQSR